MALDIKKILDDINPSEKVMKWLIVALVASVTVIFGWGIKRGKAINDLEILRKDVIELTLKVESLQKNTPRAIEAEISNEIKDVKVIVFKEIDDLEATLNDKITLVVSSQGEVTKEWLLRAIDMRARQDASFRVYSSANKVKSLSIESPEYNEYEPVQSSASAERLDVYEIMEIDTDSIVIEDPEELDESIDEENVASDTISKKRRSLFGIFKNKDK